jgi:threonine/homoserine/homoserine lactone efflux protein
MDWVTNPPNPKVALLYFSLLPQFADPSRGNVLTQSLVLDSPRIIISLSLNAPIATAAGTIAAFLGSRPFWRVIRRGPMGTVLAGPRLRMAFESRR